MDGITRTGFATLLGIGLISGCGQDAADGPAPAAATVIGEIANTTATGDIARAATDFMDAIIQGDSQRASGLLTPQAIERIIATKTQFNPSGLQSATFRIGEVRTPSPDQAIVQFLLTDKSVEGKAESEEGCCLMKRVENSWRVSGIAYGRGPTQPWLLSDFETGQTTSIVRQSRQGMAGQPSATTTVPSSRPSPPRTAAQPLPDALR
jgi:hypothetical protein